MKKIVMIVAAVVVIGVIIGVLGFVLSGGDDEGAAAGLIPTAGANILVQADSINMLFVSDRLGDFPLSMFS